MSEEYRILIVTGFWKVWKVKSIGGWLGRLRRDRNRGIRGSEHQEGLVGSTMSASSSAKD